MRKNRFDIYSGCLAAILFFTILIMIIIAYEGSNY